MCRSHARGKMVRRMSRRQTAPAAAAATATSVYSYSVGMRPTTHVARSKMQARTNHMHNLRDGPSLV